MFVADRRTFGEFIGQHHDPDVPLAKRSVPFFLRVVGRETFDGYDVQGHNDNSDPQRTAGDLQGSLFWPQNEKEREIPSWWLSSCAAMSSRPAAITKEECVSAEMIAKRPRTSTVERATDYGQSQTTSTTKGAGSRKIASATDRSAFILPAGRDRWEHDKRYKEIEALVPEWASAPKGVPGVAVALTQEYGQREGWMPITPIVATHNNPEHQGVSGRVFETTKDGAIDIERRAPVHGFWRVVRSAGGCGVPCGPALTWQLGVAQDGSMGLGLVTLEVPKSLDYKKPDKPDRPTTQPNLVASGKRGFGGFGQGLATVERNQASTVERDPVLSNTPTSVHAVMSYARGGPLHPGDMRGDAHQLGVDEFKNAINVGGLNVFSLKRGDGHDAPDEVDGIPYIPGAQGQFLAKTYYRHDSSSSHPWYCGTARGLRRWETESHEFIPEDLTTTPRGGDPIPVPPTSPPDPPPITGDPPTGEPPPPYIPVGENGTKPRRYPPLPRPVGGGGGPTPPVPTPVPFPIPAGANPNSSQSYHTGPYFDPDRGTAPDEALVGDADGKNEPRNRWPTHAACKRFAGNFVLRAFATASGEVAPSRGHKISPATALAVSRAPDTATHVGIAQGNGKWKGFILRQKASSAKAPTAQGGEAFLPPETGTPEEVRKILDGYYDPTVSGYSAGPGETSFFVPGGGSMSCIDFAHPSDGSNRTRKGTRARQGSGGVLELVNLSTAGVEGTSARFESDGVVMRNASGYDGKLDGFTNPTADRVWYGPDQSGTLALTKDGTGNSIYGDGSDGDLTVTGNTLPTSSKNYNNVVIQSGGLLQPANAYTTIRCQSLEIQSGGTFSIKSLGGAASAGGVNNGSNGGDADPSVLGGAGGDGGDTASYTGGSGGSSVAPTTQLTPRELIGAVLAYSQGFIGGAGGGGGAGDGTNAGGNGGQGGGFGVLLAKSFSNEGTVEAPGSDGQDASGGNAAGGGGGEGGVLVIISNTPTADRGSGTYDVSGGTGGSGSGTGEPGSNGADGEIIHLVN